MSGRLGHDYQQAGTIARAIVAKRVAILGGLGIVLGTLAQNRVITVGLSNGITHWSEVTLTVLGVVSGVLWAHQGTTPADPSLNPTDKYGNRLVSDLSIGPHPGTDSTVDSEAAFAAAAAIQQPAVNAPTADPPAQPTPVA